MYKTGHWGASLLLYAPVGFALAGVRPAFAVVGGAVVLALARLPDVDHRLPVVSHRGVTHTLLFALAVGAVVGAAGYALGVGVGAGAETTRLLAVFGAFTGTFGIVAHLAADWLTPSGVPLLWPLTGRRYSVGVARADNVVANYGLLVLGIAATAAALYVGAPR